MGSLKKLVIFGAVYFDLIKLINAINRVKPTWQILGFIDDTKELQGKTFGGYPILGGRELVGDLSMDENTYFFNNVPTWPKCQHMSELLMSHGCKIPNLIHPSVDMTYVEMGHGCIIPDGCVIGGNVSIGDFVSIRVKSSVNHDVRIEDFVFIGPGVTIGGHANLKKGCFISAGATVLGEKTVGEGSVVGAGAVVISDVKSHITVVGVPAKEIKRYGDNQ